MTKKSNKAYISVSGFSVLIRSIYLPNPFELLEYGSLYNVLLSALLVPISFKIVGLFYSRGEAPVLGSLAFLFVYTALTFLIMFGVIILNFFGIIS